MTHVGGGRREEGGGGGGGGGRGGGGRGGGGQDRGRGEGEGREGGRLTFEIAVMESRAAHQRNHIVDGPHDAGIGAFLHTRMEQLDGEPDPKQRDVERWTIINSETWNAINSIKTNRMALGPTTMKCIVRGRVTWHVETSRA